jgi:acylphosphatase
MKRAIVIVTGKVQKVRYRSKVGEIADTLGIVGVTENLDDGSVRIVAEGEAKNLDAFIAKIKIKNYLIDVQDVSASFEAATGEFSAFKKVISGTMYEIAERLDEAANVLERLTGVVMHGNDKIIGTIEQGNDKLADKQDVMTEKLDNFHYDTIQRFDNLDTTYERIAENIERILEELKEERKEYRETVERLVNAIIESGKERKER